MSKYVKINYKSKRRMGIYVLEICGIRNFISKLTILC
jgi:hypothetical protein